MRKLTKQQKEIIKHIATGKKDPEIAKTIGFKIWTLRYHINRILDITGVNNRIELVSWGFRNGILR